MSTWFYWALLSAVFAALTAIFAKVGIRGVDSDLATLVRTGIIIVVLAAFVAYAGKWSNPLALSGKTWLFLTLSALTTGASWVCYFRALQIGEASKVAPVDKFSLVLVAIFAVIFLHERPSGREWTGIGLVAAGLDPTTDYSSVISHVQSVPENFGLISPSQIQDARMGGLMMAPNASNGIDVQFKIQTSDDLGGTWDDYMTVNETIPLPENMMFMRIQAEGL
jgi:bacterial/archaeal transporter family protein